MRKTDGLLFPLQASPRGGFVLGTLICWAWERKNTSAIVDKWTALDWYTYEKINFLTNLDYDDLVKYHNSNQFVGLNQSFKESR